MTKFDDACARFNSLSENEMIAYFNNTLNSKKTKEIDTWAEESEDFSEALKGFKLIVDQNPNQTFNNFFQKLKEDFASEVALNSMLERTIK